MKKNIVLLCLEKNYSRNFGKKLADNLEMFFVDVNDILEYNLINNQMLESAGKVYFEKEKRKVIAGFADYENAIFCGSFELFSQNNNLEHLKNSSVITYLRLEKDEIQNLQIGDDMLRLMLAFDAEDEFCQKNSDVVANVNSNYENSVDIVKQALKNFYSKTENQK